MEQKLIQFIKKPSVIQSIYVICCMIISFGFGIFAEYSLLNRGNNSKINLPEQPVPLAIRYKTSNQINIYDSMDAITPTETKTETSTETLPSTAKNFVASKTGTKYYPIDCGSISRIKEENRIYFTTEDAAKEKGYERTTACK